MKVQLNDVVLADVADALLEAQAAKNNGSNMSKMKKNGCLVVLDFLSLIKISPF